MNESNYNTQQRFEALVVKGRSQPVHEVNVRAKVRAVLLQKQAMPISVGEGISETLVSWFAGIRGRFFAGAFLLMVLLTGILLFNQTSELWNSQSQDDGITVFMDSGDWSELL